MKKKQDDEKKLKDVSRKRSHMPIRNQHDFEEAFYEHNHDDHVLYTALHKMKHTT